MTETPDDDFELVLGQRREVCSIFKGEGGRAETDGDRINDLIESQQRSVVPDSGGPRTEVINSGLEITVPWTDEEKSAVRPNHAGEVDERDIVVGMAPFQSQESETRVEVNCMMGKELFSQGDFPERKQTWIHRR
jgi:hypothetical protein